MVSTMAVVVALSTVLDVQITLARIDPNDSSTWPEMGPEIGYFFIPVLAALLAVAAVILNALLTLMDHRHLSEPKHWAALGGAFALVSVALPVSALGIQGPVVLGCAVVFALFAAVLVRRFCGVPGGRNAV